MSTAPIPMLVDSMDSFYQFIKGNVTAINSARVFSGIVDARDWPPKGIVVASPYLAVTRDLPVRTKQSFYAPLLSETVEWRWVVEGDNIPANAQAANRGDKYRLNVQIMQELLSAHNPGFAPKNQFSVTSDVNNNPVQIVEPYNPPEFIWWSIPSFVRKLDQQTGMIYMAAQVSVSGYAPISVNLG